MLLEEGNKQCLVDGCNRKCIPPSEYCLEHGAEKEFEFEGE